MSQAASKSLLYTSTVGKMVLSTGKGGEDKTGQIAGFRGLAGTPGTSGEKGSFGLYLEEDETEKESFSFPQSLYFLTSPVEQDIHPH